MDNLPAYLESFCRNPDSLKKSSKKNGAPHTIIVTGAGLRAANLVRFVHLKLQIPFARLTFYRALRGFAGKDNTISKLVSFRDSENQCLYVLTKIQFAKHMKVDEQVKFLKGTRTGIAIGTPARLSELIQNG